MGGSDKPVPAQTSQKTNSTTKVNEHHVGH
jgi:hypothetical protein